MDNAAAAELRCLPIRPTVLQPSEPLAMVLIVLSLCCAITALVVICVYTIHRNHRLIKATSRELSATILAGEYISASMSDLCSQNKHCMYFEIMCDTLLRFFERSQNCNIFPDIEKSIKILEIHEITRFFQVFYWQT
jgi:hypothetical protein